MINLIKNLEVDSRLPKGDMSGIYLRDCNWSVKTAGPSPYDNERTELFLLGCEKAMSGNPCEGCFNKTTWDKNKATWTHNPVKMAEHIKNNAPNKYITIGGGEPTDQIENLIILCRELKKYGFHIMMYTWRDLMSITSNNNLEDPYFSEKVRELLEFLDIVVDGEYIQMEHKWDGKKKDGFMSSVGSGNQIIWNIKKKYGFSMRDIKIIFLTEEDNLQYALNGNSAKTHKLKY